MTTPFTMKKTSLWLLLIGTLMLFAIKIFQSTPLSFIETMLQPFYYLFASFFIFVYFFTQIKHRVAIDQFTLYFLALIIVMPIYSALIANITFNQPIIYGFLSQRTWFTIATALVIYYLLKQKKITINELEYLFLFLSWSSLIFYLTFIFLGNPEQFIEEGSKFVRESEGRGIRYGFNTFFISFGSIYYFVKYSTKKNIKYLIYFLIYFAYIVLIIKGRAFIFQILLAYLFFLFVELNPTVFIKRFLKFFSVLLFFYLAILFINPEYVENMVNMFSSMFTVLSGEESNDASANARIYETLTVLSYFNNNDMAIYTGVGNLSNQWNDGFSTFFGYFYPTDIGIIGGAFVYGIIGLTFAFFIPIILSIRLFKKLKYVKSTFVLSLKYLLVYLIIASINKGFMIFSPALYTICLFILKYYLDITKHNEFRRLS